MGKVVKSAAFSDAKYVVNVPRVETPIQESRVDELDDRFGASFGVPSTNGVHHDDLDIVEAPQPEPTVDWEQLRADAEAIVDRASADAESLVRQAEAHALKIVEDAEARVAEIEDGARRRGHEEGYALGKDAGEEELRPVISTFRELIESVRSQRSAVVSSSEPELVRLAMAIAERIVHTQVESNRDVVVENVRSALTRLVTREVVTLRVNPTDLDTIRHHRERIVAASDVEHLRIVEDQRVDRGGVVVETEAGTIDAKIATQLREAKRAILTDEALALDTPVVDDELEPSAQRT